MTGSLSEFSNVFCLKLFNEALVATIFNTILSIREVPHTHEEREGPGTLWFFLPLLATNLVATFLVGYKVWSVFLRLIASGYWLMDVQCRSYRSVWSELSNVKVVSSKSPVEMIMVIIVESGVLFCFYWVSSLECSDDPTLIKT